MNRLMVLRSIGAPPGKRVWRKMAAAGIAAAIGLGGTAALSAVPASAAAATVSLAQSNATPFVDTLDTFSATVTNGGVAVANTPVKFHPTGGLLPNEAYIGIAKATSGYWLAGLDGVVLPEGGASAASPPAPMLTVGIAADPTGGGYWLLGADGTVEAGGNAQLPLNPNDTGTAAPVVAIASGPTISSYFVLTADGTVTGFGGAVAPGSPSGLNAPAIGLATNSAHTAYTVCEADGACQPFGAGAPAGDFKSSTTVNNPLIAIAPTGNTAGSTGMWGLHADNTTSAVNASNPGNVSDHNTPMLGLTAAGNNTTDYLVVGLDGQVVTGGGAANVGDAFTQNTNAQGVATLRVTSLGAATTTMTAAAITAGGASNQLNTTWVVPPGYWMTGADGGVFTFGIARYFGSTGAQHLNKPIVGMAPTPDGGGYWLVASDGGVFTFGDAQYFGSTGAQHLNQPIVGMAATSLGDGYWLVAADGGVFSFGPGATFFGSTGAQHLNKPIVGIASTFDDGGYWLVASDGGIFTFGNAPFMGSTGAQPLNKPVVGMTPTIDNLGYWLVASDGGIFTFGDASYLGSTGAQHLNRPIVGMAPVADGNGYWLFASDGGVFTFGSALFAGSLGAQHLNAPIVGGASVPFFLLDVSAASTGSHRPLNRTTVDGVLARKGIHWAG